MVERPAELLEQFKVSARTFQAGALCGGQSIDDAQPYGHLHLIRDGAVEVRHGEGPALRIKQPSLLLYPRPMAHRFITHRKHGANVVCAHLSFEGNAADQIVTALPSFIWLPLSELQGSEAVVKLLFEEARAHNCGRQAMLDRLLEVVLIQSLRHLMPQEPPTAGLLAGLGHPQMRRALVAIYEQPETDWSLQGLAAVAGMSRSAFANSFREIVGVAPETYLLRFRIFLEWYTRASAKLDFFTEDINRFVSTDHAQPPPDRPVVFVGSSSIRFWDTLETDMAPLPVLNRGFGGAHISHVVHFADNIVIRHKPRAVVLYAGDNDLDKRTGKSAEDVVREFRTFVSRIQAAVPDARIYYVSIKPSRLRCSDWPKQQQANQQISVICATDPRLAYIDVATPMLAAGDPPSPDLFRFDGLHLSAKAYALWSDIIKSRLLQDLGTFAR